MGDIMAKIIIAPEYLRLNPKERALETKRMKRQIEAALVKAGSPLGLRRYNKIKKAALKRRQVEYGNLATCRKCGVIKPYTPNNFYPRLGHLCRPCGRIYIRGIATRAKAVRIAKSLGYIKAK